MSAHRSRSAAAPSRLTASRALIAFAVIGLLAGWVRVANYPIVLVDGDLIPQEDADSAYHLWRIQESLPRLPDVLHFDPWMDWPKGAFCPWADGFDLGGAAWARLFGGATRVERARIAIGLWPVALGLLAVWSAAYLVRVVAPGARSGGAALASALATALLPIGVTHSRFGRVDHHVFEELAMTLLAAWSLKRLPLGRRSSGVVERPILFEIEGALLSALAVYGFVGSPLYVAIAAIPLALAAFEDARIVGSGALGLLGGALLSALLTIPALPGAESPLAFKVPSMLQPLLLAIGAIVLVLCAAAGAWRRRLTKKAGAVVLLAFALALLLAPLAGAAMREVREGISSWLLHRDPWLETINEFKPLLVFDAGVFTRLDEILGWWSFPFPIALGMLLRSSAKRSRRMAGFLAVTLVLTVLTLVQCRFSRVMVPFIGAVLGLAAKDLLRCAVLRSKRARRRRLRGGALVVAPSLAFLVVSLADGPTRANLALLDPIPPEPFVEAAFDLRDRPLPKDQGVFTTWTAGHHVEVLARVPIVTNGYGAYLDADEFWKAENIRKAGQEELENYLDEHRIGALIEGTATMGRLVKFYKGALAEPEMKRIPLSPLLLGGSGMPEWDVPHLEHLMPRFASGVFVSGLRFRLPYVWGYDRVRGARLRGSAQPRARVVAELGFVEHKARHTYKAWTDADEDGRWEIVVPFPSGLVRPTIVSDPRWRVRVKDGAPIEIGIAEEAVRGGAVLEAGALE
jgi:AglB-like glycosylation protein